MGVLRPAAATATTVISKVGDMVQSEGAQLEQPIRDMQRETVQLGRTRLENLEHGQDTVGARRYVHPPEICHLRESVRQYSCLERVVAVDGGEDPEGADDAGEGRVGNDAGEDVGGSLISVPFLFPFPPFSFVERLPPLALAEMKIDLAE